ncbi:MAG: hypothetical protein ACKOX1_07490 [Ignavibacteria bacterium]
MKAIPFYVHCFLWLSFLIVGFVELAQSHVIMSAGAFAMGLAFYRFCQLHIPGFKEYRLRYILQAQIFFSGLLWVLALYIL